MPIHPPVRPPCSVGKRPAPAKPRRFDRRGAIAMTFSMMAVPMFLTIGGAVDYARSVHYRAELQVVTDNAALAGATLYQGDSATATTAQTMVANYLNRGTALLPASNGVTTTVATSVVPTGYQVLVTATSSMSTSFLGVVKSTIPVTTSSTALMPFPYGNVIPGYAGTKAFSASAADTNKLYWYLVPADNSVPPDSAMTLLWSNKSGVGPTSPPPIPLTWSSKIGFALRNTTANYGTHSCGNNCTAYNTNQYGSSYNQTHTFYSHLNNPTNSANGYNTINNPTNQNSVNGSGASSNNCTLQVVTISPNNSNAAPVIACFPTTAPVVNGAPMCSQLAGKWAVFFWNDMGGNPDDKDYNDAQFTYYCGGSSAGGGSTGNITAILTN